MSTHEHLIVTDTKGLLPDFLRRLHRLVSLGITVLPQKLGRRSWTLRRPEVYFNALAEPAAFRRAYREALEQWRALLREVVFSLGTWVPLGPALARFGECSAHQSHYARASRRRCAALATFGRDVFTILHVNVARVVGLWCICPRRKVCRIDALAVCARVCTALEYLGALWFELKGSYIAFGSPRAYDPTLVRGEGQAVRVDAVLFLDLVDGCAQRREGMRQSGATVGSKRS